MISPNNIVTATFYLCCLTEKQLQKNKNIQKVFSFTFTYPDLPQKNILSLHGAFFLPSWHLVLKL